MTERGGLFKSGGRFAEGVDTTMKKFNDSIPYDQRLYAQDVKGSIAYSKALVKMKLITEKEQLVIENGLKEVQKKWESGEFEIQEGDEDIHTANERQLSDIIGKEIAGKLHTGRSRNDQVAVDVRLWLRDELTEILQLLENLITTTVQKAEEDIDLILPGYTHLQRAQPIRWSHWLLSHVSSWIRDFDRLKNLQKNPLGLGLCPLGSSALAGNPFGVDREALADDLGFEGGATWNSLDSTSDRDFIAEFLFACSLLMVHISRISEDFCIYCTAEFNFVSLSDRYSTGSSLMPQKKNPDSTELLRGKSGRVVGALHGLLLCMKGLPSTYNKDLQEDKEGMFDTADTVKLCLRVLNGVISTMTVNGDSLKKALSPDLLATDLADYLVTKGIPFRETHHIVGRIVRLSADTKTPLDQIPLSDLKEICDKFEEDVTSVWSYEHSVERRNATGGTAKVQILSQIKKIRSFLSS
eukprot:TRINITY_DN2521_c1_g1_i2.p1 TRINITY_DN2521_c1_g1~~TRINITY_DN2521_c1_g1_i2.p1  ORF type:complete len:490 (+),score=95.58 TRINITY_DN2521_c1_g1_i2:67-1470(+)